MTARERVVAAGRRALPLLGPSLAGTTAVILCIMAPDLIELLPSALRFHRVRRSLLGLAAAYAIVRLLAGRRRTARPVANPLRRFVDGVDRLTAFGMAGGLTIIAVAACVALLGTWVPHYLFWPWYRDSDTFATLAQSWDAGILPYRDIRGYNFPGAIYLFWILGRVAGWGRTWALYAVDAAALVLLGVMLAAWSRRCLGGWMFGVVAYLVFLASYLNLDYQSVAQRDWHASLFVVLGLLVLQAWPGRTSRLLSAMLAALALTIRPHVLVFLPAFWAAIAEGVERPGPGTEKVESRPRAGLVRSLGEWSIAFGAFAALAFSPLLIAGIADDLVRGLRIVAYGGPYHPDDPVGIAEVAAAQLQEPTTLIVVGSLALVLLTTRGASRRRVATWAMAMAGSLVYRLVHPVPHFYLIIPVILVGAVVSALSMAWIANRKELAPTLQLIALLLLISEMSPRFPLYCNLPASLKALGSLARGETFPTWLLPGSAVWFDAGHGRSYSWDSYRDVLIYLRSTTAPTTLVANVLNQPPFPAINGPAARLSPFRAESGICWMWLVDIDLEPEFTSELERSTDVVVVWAPSVHARERLALPRLAEVIRKDYHLETRFGRIEVWRRAEETP